MKYQRLSLLLIGLVLFNINSYSQVIFDSNASAIFYKKTWNKEDFSIFTDTTKTIIVFNDNYNINNMIFNTLNNAQCIYEKYNYTHDSLKYCVLNKAQMLIHLVVYDSVRNIKEEGNLKGIGPFAISQNKIPNNSSKCINFTLYYYMVKFGNWKEYDNKGKKLLEIKYDLPKLINFDDLLKENKILVSKRRKKYIKINHLKNDYYE